MIKIKICSLRYLDCVRTVDYKMFQKQRVCCNNAAHWLDSGWFNGWKHFPKNIVESGDNTVYGSNPVSDERECGNTKSDKKPPRGLRKHKEITTTKRKKYVDGEWWTDNSSDDEDGLVVSASTCVEPLSVTATLPASAEHRGYLSSD